MDKLKKKKQLDLENVHTYEMSDACFGCTACFFVSGGLFLAASIALTS